MIQSGNMSETGLSVMFNLFLEFVTDLKSLCKGFQLDTNLSFDIRYADHTTIMFTMFERLQFPTEGLLAACRKWGMKINISKYIGHHFIGEAYYSGRLRERSAC